LQEVFSDLAIAELAVRLNREAYMIISGSGVKLADIPGYSRDRIKGLVSMDTKEAAMLLSKIMVSLSNEPLYGSILQSIKRGRKSEIDYINGEIVRLGWKNKLDVPLNAAMVKLVHRVEDSGRFFSAPEMLERMKKFN